MEQEKITPVRGLNKVITLWTEGSFDPAKFSTMVANMQKRALENPSIMEGETLSELLRLKENPS
jgi:hypothetical protein